VHAHHFLHGKQGLPVFPQPACRIVERVQTLEFGSLGFSGVFDTINSILEAVDNVEVGENPHFSFPPLPDKKKAGATSFTGNPAVSPYSGNPAIRLLRTRGFPSPDCSGFGFNYSMSRLLIAIAVPETIILYF
jgi:hypothetical protein